MAYDQSSFSAPTMHLESHKQKWDSLLPSSIENSNGCFDCNICLESCNEPVVTLCGHLYCWPCIYKWLHVQTSSLDSEQKQQQPKCPICKASISSSSLVPLYGRGRSTSESGAKKCQLDSTVPARPPALGLNTLLASSPPVSPRQNRDSQQYSRGYASIGSPTTTSFFSPTIHMVSEIVFAGIFGSSETNMFAYPYSNSYPLMGSGSPRLRRHEIQLDKSLNRVSIFLFCCIALCLVLF